MNPEPLTQIHIISKWRIPSKKLYFATDIHFQIIISIGIVCIGVIVENERMKLYRNKISLCLVHVNIEYTKSVY